MQNGLNVEVDLYHALKSMGKGEPRIISAAIYIATNLVDKNVVEHGDFVCPISSHPFTISVFTLTYLIGLKDRVQLGVYRHDDYITATNTPSEEALLSDFASILVAGGSQVKICTQAQCMKFYKNFWNVAYSSFATLTGYRIPAIFRPPPNNDTV